MSFVNGSEGEGADEDVGRLEALLSESDRSLQAGEHTVGTVQAREAAALAERLDLRALQGRACTLLGIHELRLGEHESSLVALHRALALYSELGDLSAISASLNWMVLAYYGLGLQEEALEYASRSLEAAKQSGDALTLAWAYNRAGLGHAAVGNIAEGITSLEFALNLAREIGDQEAIFAALNNLIEDLNSYVRALLDEGAEEEAGERIERALELAPDALRFAKESNSPYDEAIILLTYGQSLAFAGEHERARTAFEEAERLGRAGGYRPVLLEARYKQARLESDRGDLRSAIAQYEALLSDTDPARDALVLVDIHLEMSRAHKQLGEFEQALEHHERFHELERDQQTQLAKTRARVLSTHLDLDRAQLEAQRATLEAELERTRTRELEAQALALREERELLSRRADQDGLTGLWNRRYVEHALPRMIREAGVRREPISVAYVDVDHFKSVNDQFGHLIGDDVLRHLADVLRANVRPSDIVARQGGEEFVVLLPGASGEAAVVLGQRLCDAVRETDWELMAPGCAPTISVGVASARPDFGPSRDVERAVAELLGRADRALYAAKRAGRDRVQLAH